MNSFRILFYLIAYVITRTHANNATEKVRILSVLLKSRNLPFYILTSILFLISSIHLHHLEISSVAS